MCILSYVFLQPRAEHFHHKHNQGPDFCCTIRWQTRSNILACPTTVLCPCQWDVSMVQGRTACMWVVNSVPRQAILRAERWKETSPNHLRESTVFAAISPAFSMQGQMLQGEHSCGRHLSNGQAPQCTSYLIHSSAHPNTKSSPYNPTIMPTYHLHTPHVGPEGQLILTGCCDWTVGNILPTRNTHSSKNWIMERNKSSWPPWSHTHTLKISEIISCWNIKTDSSSSSGAGGLTC